ncbi:MAG: preprotein translocase subunit SecA [Actinobacteria bacterium]|nr:preprotein translocase subunit SecA [Actinomycetota bacterium]
MSVFSKILRAGEGKKVRALQSIVPDINALEPEIEALSDDALRHKTVEFREELGRRVAAGESEAEVLNDFLIEAFAVVREAARRVIGQRHFDVQLMGGAALHFGWIAEMKTGEGKTLVSTLPVYLNGLTGRGVHLVTVNDYLARFHAEWMGQIYNWLGLTVGLVVPDVRHDVEAKKAAYACDVTYGTNQEFGFDYLFDNLAKSKDHMRQRGHVYAIVDEVDSILIDEARTPLIISGSATEAAKLYQQFAGIARSLQRDVDYDVDEEKRTVAPTEEGIEKVERMLGIDNLYDLVQQNYVHQLQQALRAKELYKRDKDYIVVERKVKIVDEFTGRVLEGRRWSEGLHQAVEAKERVPIEQENVTQATVTLQNYFRMYEKLAGMTGTAETEASEFANTYSLPVVPIPTNKPMIRDDKPDLIYKTELAKFEAAIGDIEERYERGQPVLVGTASVEKSEVLSRMLEKRGIAHEVLNAKQHAREAGIVAQAGRLNAVTVATNMAGRGVDILLGGNPEGLAAAEVAGHGLELHSEEGQALYKRMLPKYESECAAEGEKIRELGGLYVLGSERHESRRIDNQLRGRAGRQGDPGESRFFLSLEDDLMRIFATGAMNYVMGKALPDDVPIESKMVTKAVQRAQNTVEARNAEIRKNVLKYDEVYNEQRKVIYARRMQVLDGADLRSETLELIEEALTAAVDTYCTSDFSEEWDVEGLLHETGTYYPTRFTAEELAQASTREQLTESLVQEAEAHYGSREQELGEELMRELERRIMLQIIDQHWVEHLSAMDYLNEGIGLRAMGQKDPLVEWQREGFEMFGRMMDSIDDDYVKYVMHVQVVIDEPEEPDLTGSRFTAAEDPVQSPASIPAPAAEEPASVAAPTAAPEASQSPVVKGDHEKLGRNEPCWCASGKKFKHCHGSA